MAVSTLRSMGSGSCWGGGEGGEGAGASGDPLGVVGLGADGAGGAGAGVWVGGVGRGGVAGAGAGAGPESTRDRTAKRPGLARRRSRPPDNRCHTRPRNCSGTPLRIRRLNLAGFRAMYAARLEPSGPSIFIHLRMRRSCRSRPRSSSRSRSRSRSLRHRSAASAAASSLSGCASAAAAAATAAAAPAAPPELPAPRLGLRTWEACRLLISPARPAPGRGRDAAER